MSSKKSKTRNLRHILESPFNLKWSEKTVEEITLLQEALNECLPLARLEKKQINLNFKARQENIKEKNVGDDKIKEENLYRSYIVPGFQAVLSGLEKNELSCFITDNDITPILMLKVLLVYGHTNNVPFTIVPGLRAVTKSALGFSTMVLGFKKLVGDSNENNFHSIFKMVSQNPTIIDIPFVSKSNKEGGSKHLSKSADDFLKSKSSKETVLADKAYLFRQNKDKRAFTPVIKKTGHVKDTVKDKTDSFIPFCAMEPSNATSLAVTKEEVHNTDSDDSQELMDFFVDNIADESLLEEGKRKGNVQTPNFKHKPRFDQKNSLQKHEGGKKFKTNEQTINYKPLIIKSVTNNLKRNKKRKRNKKVP